jgi:hypothetical protein
MMLNRMYHTSNLRNLALEGSIIEKPRPDLSWFTSKPDGRDRVNVALQLLRNGEVSAAEFAAMALPGFQLHPIERESEHAVDLPDAAARSYTSYLVSIAVMSMTDSQATQAEALLKQGKHDEAITFIVGTSPWTQQRYELFNRKTPVTTTEELRKLGTELEDKARQVGADVSEYRNDLQSAQKFFDTARKRSDTMAGATADIATAHVGDCAPIAMNIGAAHTSEIAELFGKKNISYAMVSPSSLATGTAIGNGSLSIQAYDRKMKSQSVDPAGGIGAFLDGRRKPPLASQNKWFKAKAEISYAIVGIARAVAAAGGSDEPPFGLDQKQLGLAGSGAEAPSIAIDLATIKIVPGTGTTQNEVIFRVTLLDNQTDLWVRAGAFASQPGVPGETQSLQQSIDQALKQMREELSKEPPVDDPAASAQPTVVEIVPGIKAAVANSEAAAAAAKLTPA